jgi:DNA/RNA-binding protein KIN17
MTKVKTANMPQELRSTRHVDKRIKMAGLSRLRWYCTPCEQQCRDQNVFKQHTLLEAHVCRMESITDVNQTINDYSKQFQTAFLGLLRTSHREKAVHLNQFYQTYIADKQHIHMNSMRWTSLTEFVKYLGKEGLCRFEEKADGSFIAWIDRSPKALLRAANTQSKKNADAA